MSQPRKPAGTPVGGRFDHQRLPEPEAIADLVGEDGFPVGLERVLNPGTREAWRQIRDYLPPGTYLAGGTAIAVHLRHRESRDLDFFTTEPLDVDELHENLERSPLLVVVDRVTPAFGNMRITLGRTKIDFSNAATVSVVEPMGEINGVKVAGVGDLLAMKLTTIAKRRQLRDYEDLRAIELRAGRRLEEGLALAQRRYGLRGEASLVPMVAAMAKVDECEPDELVATPMGTLVEFFRRRLPEVVASLGRWDDATLPPEVAAKVAKILRTAG